jgi:hypothetical protein
MRLTAFTEYRIAPSSRSQSSEAFRVEGRRQALVGIKVSQNKSASLPRRCGHATSSPLEEPGGASKFQALEKR